MFVIKQNDTLPILEVQLLDCNNNPVNLDLCGVRFHMTDRRGIVKINRQIEIKDIEQGIVRVVWGEGETSGVGLFKGEIQVNFPNGNISTYPNTGYIDIKIVKELD